MRKDTIAIFSGLFTIGLIAFFVVLSIRFFGATVARVQTDTTVVPPIEEFNLEEARKLLSLDEGEQFSSPESEGNADGQGFESLISTSSSPEEEREDFSLDPAER